MTEPSSWRRGSFGFYILITSAVVTLVLASLAALTDLPWIFPSLGPTAFLLFFSPLAVQSSPRNTVLGHGIGVIAGFMGLAIFGLAATGPDLEQVTWPRVGAVTFALSVTLAAMVWLGVPHTPAGATTLIVALGLLRTPVELGILMAAVVLLSAMGLGINRAFGVPAPLWRSSSAASNPGSSAASNPGSSPASNSGSSTSSGDS